LQTLEERQENVFPRRPGKLEFAVEARAGQARGRHLRPAERRQCRPQRFQQKHSGANEIYEEKWSVSQKIEFVLQTLSERGPVKFSELFAARRQPLRSHLHLSRAAGIDPPQTALAGAWQFVSQPEYAPWVIALVGLKARPPRLSQPALETLAIIAYRQPITRAEIEQVRGVTIDGVMATCRSADLIAQVGRAEVVGHPMTYRNHPLFLEYFGLRSLEGLPAADELRRIPVTHPEALLTADPGLATVPPDQLTLAEVEQEKAPDAVEPPANDVA
jgi:hypothetical protein